MSCPRHLVSLLAVAILLALPRVAAAADGGAPSRAEEIRALDAQIAAALSTHGCAVACEALGSMTRAKGRLCALDPGPRCDEARARVRDAQRKVHEACPECAATGGDVPPPEQAAKRAAPDSEPPPAAPSTPQTAEVTVAAPRRGGCAGCVVGGEGGVEGAGALAALGVIAALARRARRRR